MSIVGLCSNRGRGGIEVCEEGRCVIFCDESVTTSRRIARQACGTTRLRGQRVAFTYQQSWYVVTAVQRVIVSHFPFSIMTLFLLVPIESNLLLRVVYFWVRHISNSKASKHSCPFL